MRNITSNPPQEVDLNKQDCIIYSWFMQGYTYHEIFGLWHVLYRYFQFCSYNDIVEERGLFSDGWEEL